jgi:hypothetical protein
MIATAARVLPVAQRTPEWFAARCGSLTGSRAADMCARLKSGTEAAARRDLRTRLVVERLTGISQDANGYVSTEMQWGLDQEPVARLAYEAATGHVAIEVGYLAHPELRAGCSPDGLLHGGGAIEIKCPKSAVHLRTLRARAVPPEYLPQVQHLLWLTGAPVCDFVSFDPRFPPPLRLCIIPVRTSETERAAYELIVRHFLTEVDHEEAEVQQLLRAAA